MGSKALAALADLYEGRDSGKQLNRGAPEPA